ncbi:ABC transporter substrate-binding protein [Clostridium thermarum]|uniref:ABC transporter substrate-binding protein n=1 Tax=Clostridium thermarum TaxID=1716543 RepID=UPI0013D83278|nr:extracellular solute-binding protein [Clostridium thermarum]
MRTKKLMSLVMVLMVVSAGFIGCKKDDGGQVTDTNTPVETSSPEEVTKLEGTITVLTHRTDMTEIFQQYKEKFESQHPGTTINFEAVTDYQNTLSTRMSTKDYGDVLMMPANITKDKFKDFYLPLGTKEELSQKYNYLDNFEYEGTVYGIATGANAMGVVYNDKVLKDAGVTSIPTNHDEFMAALKAIKEKTPGIIPLYTNYVADWSFGNYVNGSQTGISGDDDYMNKMIYSKSEFLPDSATYTALKWLHDAVKGGYVEDDPMTSDWEWSKQAMADNKIGFMVLGSWAVGQMKALSSTPENVKFMPYPARKDGKAYMSLGPDYGMGININTKNPELAKAFLEFFVNEYPNNSDMISAVKGAELPDFLKDVDGVVLFENKPGDSQTTKDLDQVQKESLIALWDGKWVKTVVEIGLGNSDKTFDEYMTELNAAWVKGIESLGK